MLQCNVQVVRNLILAGHEVHVVTGAPDFVFTSQIHSPRLFLRKVNEIIKVLSIMIPFNIFLRE